MNSPCDAPIAYIERTREYYLALGYGNPYAWAHHADAPFQPLAKPLSRSRVALVTTAAPYRPDKGDQGPGAPYNAQAKFYQIYSGDAGVDHDLRIAHLAIDRKHTSMEDSGTWFPLPALRRAAVAGRLQLAPRFHGLPTHRSQEDTVSVYAPEILRRCREDAADAAILVPNCPVCHQSTSLVARHLEANGVSTVIMGCAKDIVEHCGVARFLFSDFPLGNSAGKPRDVASQEMTLELALALLDTAAEPRTTLQSPLRWSGSDEWKLDYSNAARLSPEELARRRAEFDRGKEAAKVLRESIA
jgi:D-proline reductase (dithiol) PrdB